MYTSLPAVLFTGTTSLAEVEISVHILSAKNVASNLQPTQLQVSPYYIDVVMSSLVFINLLQLTRTLSVHIAHRE